MERGYVKLYRSINQNELLDNDNTCWIIFTKLLLLVDRRTGKLTTGRKKLAAITNLNGATLYSALKRLEASSTIQLESNSTSTTIYICNWHQYQQDVNKTSSARPLAVNTIQEREEEKEREVIKKEVKEKKVSLVKADPSQERVIAEWERLTGQPMKRSKAATTAITKLLKDHGEEMVTKAIHAAVFYQTVEYRPKVFSFVSMEKKWDNLTGHMNADINAKKKVSVVEI